MADNTTINLGSGGDTISTDDLGTVKVQRVKVQYGADGSATDASSTTPLPVTTDNQHKNTYTALVNRVSTGALTANTDKAVMSFEVAAIGTKTVKLRSLLISGYATSATAGTVEFNLTRGTAASTAGTAVTPQPVVPGTTAATTVVKTLPTITATTVLMVGNATSVPATANSSIGTAVDYLGVWQQSGIQDFTLRPGNLDTLLLNVKSTAAITLTLNITAVFTEE